MRHPEQAPEAEYEWVDVAPHLESMVARLCRKDRDAIILR